MLKNILLFIAAVVVIGISFVVLVQQSEYAKQEKAFTAKCHEEGGVVVEEHGTADLLCFPVDA